MNDKIRYPAKFFHLLKKYPRKTCACCGKTLTPKVYPQGGIEYPAAFKTRRYCNLQCAGQHKKQTKEANLPTRHCEACGKPLELRRNARGQETYAQFLKRKTCNHQCLGVMMHRGSVAKKNTQPEQSEIAQELEQAEVPESTPKPVQPNTAPERKPFTGFPTPKDLQPQTERVHMQPVNIAACDTCGGNDVTAYGCRDCKRREGWRESQRTHTGSKA